MPRFAIPILLLILFASAFLFGPDGSMRASAAPASSSGSATTPMRAYVYTTVSGGNSYDISLADGAPRDTRVARLKVDSVYFGNAAARLSTDGSTIAFRVSGTRQGGSSLYSVDVKSAKYAQVSSSPNGSAGIGAYYWSPAGNTLAFVRAAPALDPDKVDDAYGQIYVYSVGFSAVKLAGSNGSDRLVGFSGDGRGVYAVRLEGSGSTALQHLVYLPLSGGPAEVILRSQPSLRFFDYAVWSSGKGALRVAFVASGDFSLASQNSLRADGNPAAQAASLADKAASGAQLAGPRGLGLGVLYGQGTVPILVGRDSEDVPFLTWSPDGTNLISGGTRSGSSWITGMAGNKRAANTPLRGMDLVSWSLDGKSMVVSDTPSTHLVTVNIDTGSLAATRYVGVTLKPSAAAVKLPVPYVQQVKDTAENGDGTWACGPTSIVMALAYFKRVDPWPTTVAVDRVGAAAIPPTATPAVPPTPKPITGADYAPYVTNKYSAFGHTYDSLARDPRGNLLAGLYGTICPTGLADWQEMAAVLSWHNLSSQFIPITWDGIVAALKRGHPVLLGNELTTEGHIILVIGYTLDGNLIVNDPYGNRFGPGYGYNDGQAVVYPWKLVTPRHALEIIGTVPPPTATPTRTATATGTPTVTPQLAVTATATATTAAAQTPSPGATPPSAQP